MKRTTMRPIVLVFWLGLLWLIYPVQAQGQNLLVNPGFEAPFTTINDAAPAPQVAQGWLPWYVSGGPSLSENVRPNYFPASDVTNGLGTPRIRNGTDAQQYHTFYATHDGGVFQRVTGVTQGAQLRFSAYVYVWSSNFDEPDLSEDPGGVVVQVGIDPSGGTSGESSNVVWSSPTVQYDAYNEYVVTAASAGTAVTVFIRTTVSEPIRNNNVYVDDASLTVQGAGATAVVPTNTPLPTNTPIPAATNTPVPTNTPLPAATSTPVVVATSTPVTVNTVVPQPTDLGIVTSTTVATDTPVQPATSTPPPAATNTPALTNTPVPTNTPPPTQEVIPTATSVTGVGEQFRGTVLHRVRSGDTVGQLASLYGSSIDAIITANDLEASALIRVGQVLAIPVRLSAPATSTPSPTPLVTATSPAPPPVVPDVPSTTTTYVVQPGDTLFRIATRFSTTVAVLARLNGIANPNVIRAGQRLVIPAPGTQGGGGDSGIPPVVTQVVIVVPVTATPGVALPGQQTTYVVQPGDTLFRIALRFGVPLSRLVQVNNISNPNRVFVGQVLVIP